VVRVNGGGVNEASMPLSISEPAIGCGCEGRGRASDVGGGQGKID